MDTLTAANNIPSTGNVFKSVHVCWPRHALAAVLPFPWQYYGPWILLAPYNLLSEISGQLLLWFRGTHANRYYSHLLFGVDMVKRDMRSKHHWVYFFKRVQMFCVCL